MAIPTRASRPGTFFITSGTYNRRRLFQVERNAELLIETFQHYRAAGHYKPHAFVVMADPRVLQYTALRNQRKGCPVLHEEGCLACG